VTRRLRIRVDHELCVGNAMCVATAPGTFAHNEYRQSEVVNPEGSTEQDILEAAAGCPVGAIAVEVETTGERLFP